MIRAHGPRRAARATPAVLLEQNWSAFHPVPALYCLPAIVGTLAIGLWLGQPGGAILATAGAFSAGFGAFQRLSRFQVAPMLLATLCMSVSTAVGTVASGIAPLDAAVVAAAAFSLGLAASFGTGPWWALLQGAIFLVISGSAPGDVHEGLLRAMAVAVGGIGQSISIALLRRLAPGGFPRLEAPNSTDPPASLDELSLRARGALRLHSPELLYAIRFGVASGAAVLVARSLGLPNGYWAAMTVLLVLRRGGAETVTRGVQRIGGTLLGAGVATLIAALGRPGSLALAPLIVASAWSAYATQWVNYGTFSVSVTSYVAFLLALWGLPETAVALHRVESTLLGGAIGMIALGLPRLPRAARRAA